MPSKSRKKSVPVVHEAYSRLDPKYAHRKSNLFEMPHKGFRFFFNKVHFQIGSVDCDDLAALGTLLQDLEALAFAYLWHNKGETAIWLEALAKFEPVLCARWRAEHRHNELPGFVEEVKRIIALPNSADRKVALRVLYRDFTDVIHEGLGHMRFEEVELQSLFWDYFTDEELEHLEEQFTNYVPRAFFRTVTTYFVQAVDFDQRVYMFKTMSNVMKDMSAVKQVMAENEKHIPPEQVKLIKAAVGWDTEEAAEFLNAQPISDPRRYHLVVSRVCPFAHRTVVARAICGLEDLVTMSVCAPIKVDSKWVFDETVGGDRSDLVFPHSTTVADVYDAAPPPHWNKRPSVPLLIDKVTKQAISNNSPDIVRFLWRMRQPGSAATHIELRPAELTEQIDAYVSQVVVMVGNFFKMRYAKNPQERLELQKDIQVYFDELNEKLSKQRWIMGDRVTEAELLSWTFFPQFDSYMLPMVDFPARLLDRWPHLVAWVQDFAQLTSDGSIVRSMFQTDLERYAQSDMGWKQPRPAPRFPFDTSHRREARFGVGAVGRDANSPASAPLGSSSSSRSSTPGGTRKLVPVASDPIYTCVAEEVDGGATD